MKSLIPPSSELFVWRPSTRIYYLLAGALTRMLRVIGSFKASLFVFLCFGIKAKHVTAKRAVGFAPCEFCNEWSASACGVACEIRSFLSSPPAVPVPRVKSRGNFRSGLADWIAPVRGECKWLFQGALEWVEERFPPMYIEPKGAM